MSTFTNLGLPGAFRRGRAPGPPHGCAEACTHDDHVVAFQRPGHISASVCNGSDDDSDETQLDQAGLPRSAMSHQAPEEKASAERSYGPSKSRLENLPAEIRFEILGQMSDLQSLKSLVHASPTMHEQYRLSKLTQHQILLACLLRQVKGHFADAYASMKSQKAELPDGVICRRKIFQFMEEYSNWKEGKSPCPELLPRGQVRWMAAYHLSVVEPLKDRYGRWALANFAAAHDELLAPMAEAADANWVLSKSEEANICQALYRYGTFQNLLGRGRRAYGGSAMDAERGFPIGYLTTLLRSIFNAWDMEAMAYIDVFMREKYLEAYFFPRRSPCEKCGTYSECQWDASEVCYADTALLSTAVGRGLRTAARLFEMEGSDQLDQFRAKLERCLRPEQVTNNAPFWHCYLELYEEGPYGDSNSDDLEHRITPWGYWQRHSSIPANRTARLTKRWGLRMWDVERREKWEARRVMMKKLDSVGYQKFL
ncbi:hypothetical protein F5Y17DRAFT_70762 [Xylariaceae sp. FL0594]|nr:hypothetical protein F5Y17DRAFT_70762 [Xylariaceae sp. FL0594]